MNDIKPNYEIDLIQLIETVWDGKWKIIAITVACVSGVFGFKVLGHSPSFVATTEIKPILARDAEYYRQSNALGFFAVYRNLEDKDQAGLSPSDPRRNKVTDRQIQRKEIPSAVLDQMFIEQLGNRHLLAGIFQKQGLLVQEDFDSEEDYQRGLLQLAANVTLVPPVNKDGMQPGESRQHWLLQFEFNDKGKWLAALAELRDTANKHVQTTVKARFENLQASAKQKREFEHEDLDAQTFILTSAYDSDMQRRLAHLTEQAAIARKLDISKQTNMIPQQSIYQNLNTQGEPTPLGVSNNRIDTEAPLYNRGYEALEKEIELIKARQDKRLFIEGLFQLEQEKLALSKDQTPERAETLFAKTPVMNPSEFRAAIFGVEATEFKNKSSRKLMLAVTAVLGGVIGVGYVLITNVMRGRREAKAV